MKRKKLIVIILITLFIIFGLRFFVYQKEKEEARIKGNLKIINESWPLLQKAINEKNSELCENFGSGFIGSFYRDVCYQKIGIEKNNTDLCDKINNGLTKFICYSRIYENKNFSFCQKTHKWIKETCYFYSGQFSSEEACTNISNILYKNACLRGLAKRKGDFSFCQGMSGGQWNDCVMVVVKTTGNFSLCNKLTESKMREKCKNDLFYTNIPFAFCEGLEEKEECIDLFLNSTEKELYSSKMANL